MRFSEFSKFFSLSLIFISLLILLDIWPRENFVKTLSIALFVVLNLIFFIRSLNSQRKNFWPNMNYTKKQFQDELKLKNEEIISYDDKYTNHLNSEKKLYLWKRFQRNISQRILERYNFKFRYFFLNKEKIAISSKISFLFWIAIISIFLNTKFSNTFFNSISYETQSPKILNFSTNLWIYPPENSKNEILFIEKNHEDSFDSLDSFLVEKNSTILINVFNLKIKDIVIKLRKSNNLKSINKNISFIDQNTVQFKSLVDEGEYSIIIKNKLFQKFNVQIDKKPKIEITSQIDIIEKRILKFDYKLNDENTRKVWFELSKSKIIGNENYEPDLSILDMLSTKPTNYFTVSNEFIDSDGNEEQNFKLFSYRRDISELPISGGKLNIVLAAVDKNDQIDKTDMKSFFLPKKLFFDPFSKELIKIRDNLFIENDLNNTSKKLLKLISFDKEKKIEQQINNLLIFIKNSKRDKSYKLEKTLQQIWRLAVYLEDNNIKNIKEQIKTLKGELRTLIDKNASDKELLLKINEIEKLIKRYSELKQNSDITEEKTQNNKTENIIKDLEDNEVSVKKDAESLISKIEQLLNENKNDKKNENKNLLRKLQTSYIEQKDLIDKTFQSRSDGIDKIINLQKNIAKIIDDITSDILKVLPEDKVIVMNLNSKLSNSIESLRANRKDEALNDQIEVLTMLKKIYKKILKKSPKKSKKKLDKEEEKKRTNGRSKVGDSSNEFDTPIIFEKNDFDEIIKKIRNMANDQNRQDKEKKYLKSLLPKF